ncbi:MAG: ABC transporter ATP-binding protein [Nitriliruptoraceae bacterium]
MPVPGFASGATDVTGPSDVSAWDTLVRGIRMSPQLRVGLPVTMLLALIATAGRAIIPIAVQQTIDRGFGAGAGNVDLAMVGRIVSWSAVAVAITALASAAMNYRLAAVVESALSDTRVHAFAHIHDLSMLHQASQQRGSLVGRVTTDVDEISRFMQWAGLNLITAIGQLTVATIVMLVYSWQLALVVLITFIPFVLAARWFQQRLMRAYMIVRENIGRLLATIAEAVVGADVVRAYGVTARTQHNLDTAIDAHRTSAVRAGGYVAGFSGSGEVFGALATAGVVVAGVILGVAGDVSPGTVVAFLFLITLFVDPVLIAGEVINEGQTAIAGWRRVLDVLDIEPDVADPPDGRNLGAEPLNVHFEDVEFRYPKPGEGAANASGPWVLHDIDVTIAARSRVAIVGETGSGKTTFAKLLTRLMDPTHGRVVVGGIDLREVTFASLRQRIVMVPQDGMLLEGTIADNVRMGRDEISDAEVTEAFGAIGLADWLDELPDGVLTPVGERGNALSAGERQLVALVRAYVAEPELLVLDEATSAVDPHTEVRLQRAIVGIAHGRTTVTIAHRLSTAEAADEVIVFDQGRIVQHGRHDELVAADGIYRRLHATWVSGTRRRRKPYPAGDHDVPDLVHAPDDSELSTDEREEPADGHFDR